MVRGVVNSVFKDYPVQMSFPSKHYSKIYNITSKLEASQRVKENYD